jgi:ParB family transcriptional regulator, chromosome partitioning protein
MNGNIKEIFHDQISDPADPMRSALDRDSLFDLAENIKQNGLINPITVRPVGDRFEVVAGHRRLSACKIAGLIKIPCVVRELDDKQTFEVMAAENIERAEVDPVDEATFITSYMEKTAKTEAEVAESLKRSVQYVRSRLAVGRMPDYMKELLKSGELKLGVALTLSEIDNDETRRAWTFIAVRDGANARQAEHWLYEYNRQKLPGGTLSDTPPDTNNLSAPRIVTFKCAIDGKDYDARQFHTVLIHESNVEIFNAFAEEMKKTPPEASI